MPTRLAATDMPVAGQACMTRSAASPGVGPGSTGPSPSTVSGVNKSGDLEQRLAACGRILDDPPKVHPNAPNGAVWRTGRACYEFMASLVQPGCRTLETGTGASTAMFAAWGCDHTTIVPSERQANIILAYCAQKEIPTDLLRFDLRPSQVALPEMRDEPPFDLVFIDGAHGYPMPTIDWFYGASLLRKDGVVVFDDVKLPAVQVLLDSYLERDDRWQWLRGKSVFRAYRRTSLDTLGEDGTDRSILLGPKPSRKARLKSVAGTLAAKISRG